MNRNLLEKFLGRGIMVSPEVAEELTESDYEKTLLEPGLTMLDKIRLQEIRRKQKITVISGGVDKTELTARDFLEYYKNKIRLLAPFIMDRLEDKLVSINKMRPGQRNTILGIVREPEENRFYLEDLTGRCVVIAKSADIRENDVIAINGMFSGEKIFADGLIYPGLPVKKEINKTDSQAKLFFGRASNPAEIIKNLSAGSLEAGVFILDTGEKELLLARIKNGTTEEIKIQSGQANITMDIADKKFKIQFFQPQNEESIEILSKAFSKRRYVARALPSGREANVIDEDTDIVFLGESQQSGFTNHKGYTFVSVGDHFVEVNLQTRETKLADF